MPHKWTFYFLMSVGFWNFLGAGVFGFLINLPIVSYFEVGTLLTPNHGHAAMMGVFGMLAVALMVFALRQVLADDQWTRVEKYVRLSFWGLNIGPCADGRAEPVPRRRASAPGRSAKRLLARAQSRVSDAAVHEAASNGCACPPISSSFSLASFRWSWREG